MSLSFLHPALLWGLAAAALPLLVHLFFRRRPRPTPFPAIDFVLRARKETERRLRLRRILLFVARTALLAAAALAIARPRLGTPEARAAAGPAGPAATVLVLDTSASMAYRLGGRTLLERAREDLLEALAALAPDEPAAVLVCGSEAVGPPDPPGFDRVALRRQVTEAAQGFAHADLTRCVAAAAQALADPAAATVPRRRLVIATDLTASAWRLDAPAPVVQTPAGPVRPEVALLDAARGETLGNRWVSGLTAEADPAAGRHGYRVGVSVSGQGVEAARDVPLVLRTGAGGVGGSERTALRALVDLPPSGAVRKTLSLDLAATGPVAVTATLPADALAEDDVLALLVDVPREVKVLVVNGAPSAARLRDAAFFLEAALSGPSSPVRPVVVDTEGFARARLADFDVVMLLDLRSPGPRAAELASFVEAGGGLFVAMGDDVDPDRWDAEAPGLLPAPLHVVKTAAERGGTGKPARLAEIDWEHPALQVFTGPGREGLESVRTWRYMLLKPGARDGGVRVLARYDDGAPALVEARRGRGRVMLHASTLDPEWSDWTIRTSFVPAMQRVAAFLAGSLDERRSVPVVVGAPHLVVLPPGATLAAVVGPDGRERRVAGAGGPGPGRPGPEAAPVVTPDRPGVWQVRVRDGATGGERMDPTLAFAVWPDPRESDTRRLEPAELTAWFGGEAVAKVATDGKPSGTREMPLWSWLLLLAVAAFLLEGLLLA